MSNVYLSICTISLPAYPLAGQSIFGQNKGVYVDRYKPLEINKVFYMGNEAGIACDITPKEREKNSVICSLTQLEVLGTDALAEEMKAYQQERIKNLARYPGNKPIGFTVTPRRKK